ncbi:Predicted DNA-binding transcriptional regulator YafY, contains an HTH and WYL domains [Paenibacillaceae bacterium GAS479]|nr:Predicted DNA-binding transcriptional regulator YafY, contains an HTH and WYL domains [Paenibacillaceae bacterium GAS479]
MKTERLFAIVMVLLGEGRVSAPELAKRFEVSVRTIYRDLDSLAQAGIPITAETGRNGGIHIMENYKLDNRFFSSSELASLLIALQSLTVVNTPLSIQHTVEKLKSLIPAVHSDSIERKLQQIVVDYAPWISSGYPLTSAHIAVNAALEQQRLITISYENRLGQFSERILEPHRLIFKENSWYLFAFCREKEGFRFFKLSRILSASLLDETFEFREVPHHFLENSFSETKLIPVLLRIHRSIKSAIADRFADFKLLETQDEYLIVEIPFMPDSYGYKFLLGLGTDCECLAPEHVRQEVYQQIRSMLHLYEPK